MAGVAARVAGDVGAVAGGLAQIPLGRGLLHPVHDIGRQVEQSGFDPRVGTLRPFAKREIRLDGVVAGRAVQAVVQQRTGGQGLEGGGVPGLDGRGRATGMPKLVLDGAVAHVVWTDVVDGTPQLKGVRIVAAPAVQKAPAKKAG